MTAARRARHWALRLVVVLLGLVLLTMAAFLGWSRIGIMDAEPASLRAVAEDPAISIAETDSAFVLQPAETGPVGTGLVFYPGAKVEADAYAARLADLVSEQGMTVVIVKPWLHLALFDRRDLGTFTEDFAEIDTWIVGGHSMGGVRACQVASDADALLLLGSYCANDLTESGLPVLSLGGSEDGLSTPEKIADARDLLPAGATMVQIDGASHASFGNYGPQDGDGTASITDEEMDAVLAAEVGELASALDQLAGQPSRFATA